jgi:hypothetical protein
MKPEFYEKQRGVHWLAHTVMALVMVKLVYKPVLNNDFAGLFEDNILAIIILMIVLEILLIIVSLQTVINQDGVYVKIFPFMWKYKCYSWNNIVAADVRKYNPLYGMGIKFKLDLKNLLKTPISIRYILSGNRGLFLYLANGVRVCIGTQKQQEMENFLNDLEWKKTGKTEPKPLSFE